MKKWILIGVGWVLLGSSFIVVPWFADKIKADTKIVEVEKIVEKEVFKGEKIIETKVFQETKLNGWVVIQLPESDNDWKGLYELAKKQIQYEEGSLKMFHFKGKEGVNFAVAQSPVGVYVIEYKPKQSYVSTISSDTTW